MSGIGFCGLVFWYCLFCFFEVLFFWLFVVFVFCFFLVFFFCCFVLFCFFGLVLGCGLFFFTKFNVNIMFVFSFFCRFSGVVGFLFGRLLFCCFFLFYLGCFSGNEGGGVDEVGSRIVLLDTVTCFTAAECRLLAERKRKADAEMDFLRQVRGVFVKFREGDVEGIDSLASDYGLGTFLYLKIEGVDSFFVEGIEVGDREAVALVRLNDLPKAASCYFVRKKGGYWVFSGIEAGGMRRAVLLR